MGVIQPYLNHLATRMNSFLAQYDLDLKRKIVSLNGKTLAISSDLNPISHGCHLTLFYPLTIWIYIFQAWYALNYKIIVVCLNG